jgi:hypothetical protein
MKSGEVEGYVYADNHEQAAERIDNLDYWVDEEYIDRYDGDTDYNYSDIEIEEEEEDVDFDYGFSEDDNNQSVNNNILENDILPPYFLAELHLV